jgi:hypothetical protein
MTPAATKLEESLVTSFHHFNGSDDVIFLELLPSSILRMTIMMMNWDMCANSSVRILLIVLIVGVQREKGEGGEGNNSD